MGVFVGIRIKLLGTEGASIQRRACMRCHVLLQDDRPLKRLIAHRTLVQLILRGVDILLMGPQAFLRFELFIADIAVVTLVDSFVQKHVIPERLLVLVHPSADLALQTLWGHVQVLHLVHLETLCKGKKMIKLKVFSLNDPVPSLTFCLEHLGAYFANVLVAALVHCPYVVLEDLLLSESFGTVVTGETVLLVV